MTEDAPEVALQRLPGRPVNLLAHVSAFRRCQALATGSPLFAESHVQSVRLQSA